MVGWSDWYPQSNSPALLLPQLQQKCGKNLIGILDQITPDMCIFPGIQEDKMVKRKLVLIFCFWSSGQISWHAIPSCLKAEDRLFQFNYKQPLLQQTHFVEQNTNRFKFIITGPFGSFLLLLLMLPTVNLDVVQHIDCLKSSFK